MLPPNLKKLKKNLLEAKKKTEQIISKELNPSELKNINLDTLQQGKDSEGNNMPSYSNPEYASDKIQINPRNRGFWDLRLTGEYYQGLNVTAKKLRIDFRQTVLNQKFAFYRKKPLGISDENLYEYLETKKPKMQDTLMKIINNGL